MIISIVPHNPLRGNGHIPLPMAISHSKQGLINPNNQNTNCLIWALLIGLHPIAKNRGRVSKYKHLFDTIKVPEGVDVTCMSLQCYRKLEEASDFSSFLGR
jgi:hypothetical protein